MLPKAAIQFYSAAGEVENQAKFRCTQQRELPQGKCEEKKGKKKKSKGERESDPISLTCQTPVDAIKASQKGGGQGNHIAVIFANAISIGARDRFFFSIRCLLLGLSYTARCTNFDQC